MHGDEIHAPTPLRNKAVSHLNLRELAIKRSTEERQGRSPALRSPEALLNTSPLRARSTTPIGWKSAGEYRTDVVVGERLKHYNLDYPEDETELNRVLYDRSSKWFSRSKKPVFNPADNLCYSIESKADQAKYLCHVLVNLYIALRSLDIEGTISISNKDLGELKADIDNLALKTDMFRFSRDGTTAAAGLQAGYESFDENELYNEDDFLNSTGPDLHATGKITTKSSSIINVNHWTQELRNCMIFDIPLSLRKSLAVTYFYLSLVRGQRIARSLHVSMFEMLVDRDDDGEDFTDLLKKSGMVLDHKPLFSFFCAFLPSPDADYTAFDLSSSEDAEIFKQLQKLALAAKPFYAENDESIVRESLEVLLSSFSPGTLSTILPIISSYVPFHYHKGASVLDYFPFCFSLWTSVSANVVVDANLSEFVGLVAEDVYANVFEHGDAFLQQTGIELGPYGIFTEDQMTFLFNRLQGHLRTKAHVHSYSRTLRPFIYSIMGDDNESFFEKFQALMRSIETFIYPSNMGFWTKPIAKFIHTFIKMYHARVEMEKEKDISITRKSLTSECNSKIIELFMNTLRTGSQNKSSEITNYYISGYAYLLDLESPKRHLIFDTILEDVYDALSGEYVEAKHRIISSFKQFTRIVRFMAEDQLYRVHITNILTMMINMIDINDVILTENIMNIVVSTASFVPFSNLVGEDEYITFQSDTIPFVQQHYFHMKSHTSTPFVYDEDILDRAFKASTTEFKNIILQYIDKLYQLVDTELNDAMVVKINQTTIVVIAALDDAHLTFFSEKFTQLFWNNDAFKDQHANYEIITTPLAVIFKKMPEMRETLIDMLIFNVKDQIDRGAGSSRSTSSIHERDSKLALYLTALNECLRYGYTTIVEQKVKLIDFYKFFSENTTNPVLDVLSSMGIHNMLSSLTTTEIVNQSMFPPTCSIPPCERWGGLQFNDKKFEATNMNFDWHDPTEQEVNVAFEIFQDMSEYAMSKLDDVMQANLSTTKTDDLVQKYMFLLSNSLSGASLLFDADFNKNIHGSKAEDPSTYREKLLLLKYIRERKCDVLDINMDIDRIPVSKDGDEFLSDDASIFSETDTASDAIVIKDDMPDELYVDEGEISEVPSAIGTPVAGQSATAASTPNGLCFRDLDMYRCNYFFGTSAEDKFENPLYFDIHKVRSKIGLFCHKLCMYLSENFENNTTMFQVLLRAINIWFVDIGQETFYGSDSMTALDTDFLENVQSLSHLDHPYTRTCLAAKINRYHESRVQLRSTNRYPSKLEVQLLKDVMKLSLSLYPNIHSAAQNSVAYAMNQLVGSYAIIARETMKALEECLAEGSNMKLAVCLKAFRSKKILGKAGRDYRNLPKLISLLLECCTVSEYDIDVHADRIISDIIPFIRVPPSVCVYDARMYNCLGPPDSTISLQVEAIKKAKQSKRNQYIEIFQSLRSDLIGKLDSNKFNWKTQMLLIRFITKFESNIEMQSDKRSTEVIIKQSLSQHPKIVHLMIKSVISIWNKLISLSDYGYDVSNSARDTFDPPSVVELQVPDRDARKWFDQEMNNTSSPEFFIDSKPYIGWLCWSKTMKAVSSEMFEINLKEMDMEVLKTVGSFITKEFVENMAATLIKENESKSSFGSTEVSFFVLVRILISKGYTPLTFEELCELCQAYYQTSDKASMIFSIEIASAMMCATKYIPADDIALQDRFLTGYLTECMEHGLTPDSFGIWSIVCWWIPSVIDVRRCPSLLRVFGSIGDWLDVSLDRVNVQYSRLTLLRNLLAGLEFRTYEVQPILDRLIFDHPYDKVREATARLFTTLVQNDCYPSADSAGELIRAEQGVSASQGVGLGLPFKMISARMDKVIRDNFAQVFMEYEKAGSGGPLSPQEMLKTRYFRLASSAFYWVREMGKGPNRVLLIPYLSQYVLPFMAQLVSQRDLCQLGGLEPGKLLLGLASMTVRKQHLEPLVSLLSSDQLVNQGSSYQIKVQLVFVEYLLSNLLLQLSPPEVAQIHAFVLAQLNNRAHVEVRAQAAAVLSDIVHSTGDGAQLQELIAHFDKTLTQYDWREKQARSQTDIAVHASLLGLGAVISAFPYAFPLPQWIPAQLSIVSSWARTSGMCGTAAKNTISDFKKVRADTWKFDRAQFTPDELEDLEGVLRRSYYA
ncbi:hypothetical protein DAKH74_005710 [Maudiozyma humilis]|uniref:Proteasome activator BLM10 n=1 Tax=Maudiozyma humilis TaxID=51915 RepID=A0AAV5RR89_MAUHU|nr:hypothetical protein DAKH74_005710 [Kazachstania humilis]